MTKQSRFFAHLADVPFRTTIRILAGAVGIWGLTSLVAVGAFAVPAQTIPFTVCKESATWTRPTASQQARIWNDRRYAEIGARAYEWTHDFLLVPPDSASIQYHMENQAGLWTEGISSPTCNNDKRGDEWIEAWILLYRVQRIDTDSNVYTITVEPTAKGFQSILFRRTSASNATFRFVDANGRLIDEARN
jgi:hypothetical protein